MCGRYAFFTDIDNEEINKIIQEVNDRYGEDAFKTGEIFPTDKVPMLQNENNIIQPMLFQWGFPNPQNKGMLINARCETLTEKPMFKKRFENKRCIVPSTGFYEWDKKTKQKYLFNLPEEKMLYMAALYDNFEGNDRFIIITTEANESMKDIHERMPLILTKDTMEDWIYDIHTANFILREVPPMLQKRLM